MARAFSGLTGFSVIASDLNAEWTARRQGRIFFQTLIVHPLLVAPATTRKLP